MKEELIIERLASSRTRSSLREESLPWHRVKSSTIALVYLASLGRA